MLLHPERASRLLTLKARDRSTQPGLLTILNKIINETVLRDYNSLSLSDMEVEISKMVNHNVLNHMFMLSNSKNVHEEVSAQVNFSLKNLKKELDKKNSNEYHYHFLSSKIDKFFSGKIDSTFPNTLKAPDGSPIGSYEDLLHTCSSEL